MSTTQLPPLPPIDGSITVFPGFVDFQAENNPDKPWAIFPSTVSSDGLEKVTYREFANATHRVAHILRPQRAGNDGEVVALVAHTDAMLYMALTAGMMRAGLVPFAMSPRNSAAAIVNMMEKTNCHRIVSQSSLSSLITEVLAEVQGKNYAIRVDELPGLYDVFPGVKAKNRRITYDSNTKVEPYPPRSKPLDENEIVSYLHSSGSTGFPKPILQTDKTLRSWCRADNIYSSRARQIQWASMALPPFHAMAMAVQFLTPVLSSCPVGLYEPQWPAAPVVPSPHNVLETSHLTGCTGMPAVPSMFEAWAHDDAAVKYLASLKIAFYAGGPLSKKAGDKLVSAGVKLTAVYAATEFGTPMLTFYPERPEDAPYDIRSPEDWEWLQIAPHYKVRWVPQGDGSFELQVLTSESLTPSVENLPDTKGYATSDLFTPHPSKPGLWKITGRSDDVITLSSGEKIVPIQQEGHIGTNRKVKGVMMFGRGKEQAGVLIELHDEYAFDPSDEDALVEFRNEIWPIVEEANRIGPTFARIYKEMIIVTPPSKPFPRAPKGTISRKRALTEFAGEIEELYETVLHSSGARSLVPPKSWEREDIEQWLTENAAAVNDERPLEPTIDLFEQGFDSLSSTFLRNRIIGALRASGDGPAQQAAAHVSQDLVFNYRTIRDLGEAIRALVDPSSGGLAKIGLTRQIESMVEKYTADMPAYEQRGRLAQSDAVVLLTGTTGNIGSHMLAAVLADRRVKRVYAMNRGSSDEDAAARQRAAFKDRGLPVELLESGKFVPLAGNLSQDRFRLSERVFVELRDNLTHIVHNAWLVHFSHPLSTFESSIAGTRRLVEFCSSLNRPIKLIYTSSIGVAQGWNPANGPVPEVPLSDPELVHPSGYAASKFVTEQLLAKAASQGFPVTSLRVGQVSGSKTTGAWNTSDWVPILVKSSLAIGCLPTMGGLTTWIPIDAVANITVDLVFSEDSPPVVNVLHPRPIPWNDIMSYLNTALGAQLPLVPMDEWMAKLDALSSDAGAQDQLDRVPALKLLDFFHALADGSKLSSTAKVEAGGIPLFQTSELQRCSASVRGLGSLDEAYVNAWVKYWKGQGFM